MNENNSRLCLHAIVHGRVQGVFFRASTRKRAIELGVTGWVRNRPDGTVEVMAAGASDALNDLLAWLHEGPPLARVAQVEHARIACPERYLDFSVRG